MNITIYGQPFELDFLGTELGSVSNTTRYGLRSGNVYLRVDFVTESLKYDVFQRVELFAANTIDGELVRGSAVRRTVHGDFPDLDLEVGTLLRTLRLPAWFEVFVDGRLDAIADAVSASAAAIPSCGHDDGYDDLPY